MFRLSASLALLVLAAPLGAQSTAPAAPAPAAAPLVVTAGARQAAEELLRLMEMDKVVRASIDVMLELQIKQQPAMEPFRATMLAWADKYVTFSEFEPGMVKIYAEAFTEAELRDLVAFYRTPTGRKLALLSPDLSRRGAAVGAAVSQAHMGELEAMVRARMAELSAEGAKP